MLNAEIFKENSLLRFKAFNRMPGRRKLPVTREIAIRYLEQYCSGFLTMPEDDQREELIDATLRSLSVSKKLLSMPELDAICSELAGIRFDALSGYCNPSGIDDGLYLIRTKLIGELRAFIGVRLRKIETELVPALAAKYPEKVDEIRAVWGDKIASSLPSVSKLPELFGVNTLAIQFEVPEGLPPELRAEEEKKLRETFEQAKQTVIAALWEEFGGLVDHLMDRLTPAPDGTAKTFQKGTIDNLRGFIEAFENRNAFSDSKLKDLVEKANGILAAVGSNGDIPKRLREYDTVREATREAFATIKAEVDKGLEEVASRVFNFED